MTDEEKKTLKRSLAHYKEEIKAELARLEAQSTAKDVAGKSIGKHGLAYITSIVVIGVSASLFLNEQVLAPVMAIIGASLQALIGLLSSIAGAGEKPDRPEFSVINKLIEKLDRLDKEEPPFSVDVEEGNVTIKRGDDVIKSNNTKAV